MFLKAKHNVTIPGYKIVRKDHSTGQGGGVALIIKDNISFDIFELNINNNKGNIEYVTLKWIPKIDILNYCNLFVVQNNNHARSDSFREMDTIDYIIISRSLIANISDVSSELDIPPDHCNDSNTKIWKTKIWG